MVYLSLDIKKISGKNLEEAKKKCIEAMGEGIGSATFEDEKETIEIDEITADKISAHSDSDLGYVSFDIPLDTEDQIILITEIIKKLNKFKGLLENLKWKSAGFVTKKSPVLTGIIKAIPVGLVMER